MRSATPSRAASSRSARRRRAGDHEMPFGRERERLDQRRNPLCSQSPPMNAATSAPSPAELGAQRAPARPPQPGRELGRCRRRCGSCGRVGDGREAAADLRGDALGDADEAGVGIARHAQPFGDALETRRPPVHRARTPDPGVRASRCTPGGSSGSRCCRRGSPRSPRSSGRRRGVGGDARASRRS